MIKRVVTDIDFNNILLYEKSCKSLFIYNISYKKFMDEKPLRIWFDKTMDLLKLIMELSI